MVNMAAGLLSAVFLVLSFPKYEFSWLAWIALVPLLLALRGLTARQAFWLGWGSGLMASTGLLAWVMNSMQDYGHLPFLVSGLLLLLLAAYVGLYTGLFCWLWQMLDSAVGGLSPTRRMVGAAAVWTTLEFVRSHALTGFPWALLGYTQYRHLPLIQVADLTGVYGLSFLIVLVNAAIAETAGPLITPPVSPSIPHPHLADTTRVAWAPAVVAVVVVAAVLSYGGWRLATLVPAIAEAKTPLRVAVIQGNIPQDVKWDARYREDTMARYLALSRAAAGEAETPAAVDLIVWPEAATPFFLEREAAERARLASFVRSRQVWLLTGSPTLAPPPAPDGREQPGGAQPFLMNSAYLLAPDGQLAGRYDKLHLVPFGEYVPFSRLLFFASKMVEGIGDFVPGSRPTVLTLGEHRLAVVICYEAIFPSLVRSFVLEGADVLVTITNDAWFGRSSAPVQHFAMAALRAVEHRVPLVRAANTGISGFVDAAGRIGQHTNLFVPAALTERIARVRPAQATVYTRVGDLFAWGCVILTAVLIWQAGGFGGRAWLTKRVNDSIVS